MNTVTINWDATTGGHSSGNITSTDGANGTVTLALDRSQSQANAETALAAALQSVVDDGNYSGTLSGATFAQNTTAIDVTGVGASQAEATTNALAFTATAGTGTTFTVAETGNNITAQVGASVVGNDAVAQLVGMFVLVVEMVFLQKVQLLHLQI